MATAKKTKPALWARAKAQAKARMGGKHSARAMQLAVKIYKKAGGGYRGAKSSSNKLSKWSKQKWGYVTKGDEKKPKRKRGRYLPKSVRDKMTAAEKAASNRKKRKAGGVGSRAKYSKKVKKAVRRAS